MAWMCTALPFFLYIGWYALIIVAGFGTCHVITSLQCGMRSALWALVVKREAVPAYQFALRKCWQQYITYTPERVQYGTDLLNTNKTHKQITAVYEYKFKTGR